QTGDGDGKQRPDRYNRQLSTALFADYLLPFETASVILLAALVGAIMLARKEQG
ncbi:NADH-quinone oxidoreductase subunit J, partial [Rhizobium ruizarguesonis]